MVAPATVLNIGAAPNGFVRGNWKLSYAPDPPGVVTEKTRAELAAGFDLAPYFTPNATGDGVKFRVRVDAATTAGTSYARSELREMTADGTTEMAFSTASGTHWIRLRGRVNHVPPVKPTVIVAQLHGGTDDQIAICTQLSGGTIRMLCRVNGTSSGQPNLANPYTVGDIYEILIKVEAGVVAIFYNDMTTPIITTTAIVDTGTSYFKAGAYINSNENDEPDDTEYGEAEIFELQSWHTGQATTYDPTNRPLPAQVTVDASSPARVTAAATAATTAAFNPPAGLLVACTSAASGAQANPTIAITNNGTALTWTELGRATRTTTGGTTANNGCASIRATVLTAARTGMTVTATQTSGSSPTSIKVYCIPLANIAGVYHAGVTIGRSLANQLSTPAFTALSAASLLLVCATEWTATNPAPTSSDTTEDAFVQSTNLVGLSGWRAVTEPTSQTADLDKTGTGAADWMYVVCEILPVPVPATAPGAFLAALGA